MYVVIVSRRDKHKSNAGQMSGYNSINTLLQHIKKEELENVYPNIKKTLLDRKHITFI